ncbi:hypothetical protein SAMN06295955_11563 [Sphingopyxis indica]|uniref:Uncharacterized protein n=2 Tax=Sphingopyxis indica TaxID=436663 RepID=A0A239KQY4_9SPHN|nr:hypothetical protein SAMN06295955_11563 [Sphingopyxis indica]
MSCLECEERRRKLRDAILRGKMAEAAVHVVAGVREMVAPAPKPETKRRARRAK